MQRHRNFGSIKPMKSNMTLKKLAQLLAKAISTPVTMPSCRWPDEFNVRTTAIAAPWDRVNAIWDQGADTASHQLPLSDNMSCVFRDSGRAYVVYDLNPSASSFSYTAYGIDKSGAQGNVAPAITWGVSVFAEEFTDISPSYFTPTLTYQPHGPLAVCYKDNRSNTSGRFFWADSGDIVDITLAVSQASGVSVYLKQWLPNGLNDFDTQSHTFAGAGSNTYQFLQLTVSGYFKVSCFSTLQQPITVSSFKVAGSTSVFQHHPLPDFFQNFGSINGVRLIGSSGMYTNTAAENYRAGVITACQVRNSTTWDTFISPTAGVGYGLVSSYEDSYDKGAFNGCYGWIKPSSHDTFKFRDYMTVNNGVLIDTFSPIVPEDDFIIIYASIPNTGSASGGTSPQAGFWTFNYDIEYATSNKWVDCRKTSTHAAAITAALAMIRNLPNFDENPSHIQDFWNYISNGFKSVDSAVVKYAPVADALVSLIGSL